MTADEPRRLEIVPPPYPKTTPGFCETGNPMRQQPARFFACGWRCPAHRPSTPKYDAA